MKEPATPYICHGHQAAIPLQEIPVMDYAAFSALLPDRMGDEDVHCLNYFAFPYQDGLLFPCILANDRLGITEVFAHYVHPEIRELPSLTPQCFALHVFEREIHENFGIGFPDHPWLKGIRFPFNRADQAKTMDNYPFYAIEGDELHEIGVGPVHAGVIEPGHFRFICNGETVLHLEIQLGYQHRGIEHLMLQSSDLKRALMAESIAGDTAVGHSTAHALLIEALTGFALPETIAVERTIALELERIAIHIGDTAALCTDVAYQLGQVVNESLRTLVINTTQQWCGNRFGKGLVRPLGTRYPLTPEIITAIQTNLKQVLDRFLPMSDYLFSMPSVLARFDGIGVVSRDQLKSIGAVGMAARMGGLKRDLRNSHPSGLYTKIPVDPVVLHNGDVLSRALLRRKEIEKSADLILRLITLHQSLPANSLMPDYNTHRYLPDQLVFGLAEGWRGEICHVAVTGQDGTLIHYKIKDPSLHNWMALALAVRNQEISDFPVCNKSFNLSYCGNDL